MATVESLLPSFRQETMIGNDPRWSTQVDWNDHDFGMSVLLLLADSQNQEMHRPGGARLLEVTKAAWDDLLAAEHAPGITSYGILLCQFLRFYIATGMMQTGARSRQLSLLFDGICLSLSDEPLGEEERTFYPNRLRDFLFYGEPSLIQGNACHTFLEWVDAFYYYGWHHDTHFGWAGDIFVPAVGYVLLALQVPDVLGKAAPAALQIAVWGARHELTEEQEAAWRRLVARVRELSLEGSVPAEVRAKLAFAFATTVGDKAGFNIAAEARSVLREYSMYLGAHEPAQLLSAIAADGIEALREVEAELLGAIRSYRAYLARQEKAKDDLAPRYGRGWVFDGIAPAIRCAILAGDTALATRILSVWQGNDTAAALADRLLFVVPTDADGPVFALSGRVRQFTAPHDEVHDQFVELTRTANQFLGTRIGVSGDVEDRALASPGRLGVTIPTAGQQFFETLCGFYRPEEVKAFVDEAGGSDGYCLIPFLQHPLTALLNRTVGLALPYSVNLIRPQQPDRTLGRAALWSFGSYTAEMEARSVTAILENGGMTVDHFDADSTIEILRECYESPEYDLIWVISHGEYDHYNPHQTFIEAGAEPLSLAEISSWVITSGETHGRRLVVLNLCDSVTTATLGGLAEIGIGALITHPNQAVIGHLWPASYRAAAVFGTLLAYSLFNHINDFFGGFRKSITDMASGKEHIELVLSQCSADRDLMDVARSVDWEGIDAWGSPVFFQ